MDPEVTKSWEDFLNPEATRSRLITASIYIAGFEVLKTSIIDRIRSFFSSGFDPTVSTPDPKYNSEVLARNKSRVHASLDWLREMKAVDEGDIGAFHRIRNLRNTLAHELFSNIASGSLPTEFNEQFAEMIELLRKIEVWWIINVEISTNPDYDDQNIDEHEIVPGPVMGMQLLLDIALGDEGRSRFYYDKFKKEQ